MNRRKFVYKSVMFTAAMVVGFLVSFVGITRPEAASPQLDTSLGKQSSKIEVYVFSDWLCPMCLKIEPAIESVFPALGKKAKIFFIDKPIHPESMNFVPYHLSFLINEKPKYLQIRKALFALAKKNRNPALDDIKAAVAPLGVTYKQLSFMEVTQTMGKSQALSNLYKVNATPTIVVVNTMTKKSKTLVGGTEITVDNLLKAVKGLE
jgi:protein-disulfide isomerase